MERNPDKSQPQSRPLDIKPDWDNVTRVAQSACHDNRGLAVITMTVFVREKDVVFFTAPEVRKIGPLSAAPDGLTAEVMETMALFFMNNSEEGFYLSRNALHEMAVNHSREKETRVRPE